jgi:hypothetical protein
MIKQPDGQLKRQRVTIGISNGTETEILDGLTAGESVVTGQGQARSRWRKDQSQGQGGQQGSNRRGQMMMMRGLGGGGRR